MVIEIKIKRHNEYEPEFQYNGSVDIDFAIEYLFKLKRTARWKEFVAGEPKQEIPF